MKNELPYDDELSAIWLEAKRIADDRKIPLSSIHILEGLLKTECSAKILLLDRGLPEEEGVFAEYVSSEPAETMHSIEEHCLRFVENQRVGKATSLHLMLAICNVKKSAAYRSLAAVGLEPDRLRTVTLALVTGGVKAQQRAAKKTPREKRQQHSATHSTESFPQEHSTMHELVDEPQHRAAIVAAPGARSSKPRSASESRITVTPASTTSNAPPTPNKQLTKRYQLDDADYPTLCTFGKNLSLAAFEPKEPLVGRDAQITQILDILGKKRANNPLLVGDVGVGKTAIVEGLAYLQIHDTVRVPQLKDRILVQLNLSTLLSAHSGKGTIPERLSGLRAEVQKSQGKVVIAFDDTHLLASALIASDSANEALTELIAAMADGAVPCIGATTTECFKKYIEPSLLLQRCFQVVAIAEPTIEDSIAILRGLKPGYAKHHNLAIDDESLESAVRLSSRYLPERRLPDKAIGLLDLACSRARRLERSAVTHCEIAEVVADLAEVPLDHLIVRESSRLLRMEAELKRSIIGHSDIIEQVAQSIRRNYAGFTSHRPMGSFLFLGPTGVGKTELVKALAEFLFQNKDAICRFDMSEFMEPHSVARLIGAPPGYVGYEQGGQLTDSIRKKPYQVVLFDEIEKAHRDVWQVLLQILDDGRLTDGRGRTIDFSNTIVIMTSNLGSSHFLRRKQSIGFGAGAYADSPLQEELDRATWTTLSETVLQTARDAFPLELWNRIEQKHVFAPLTRAQVIDVARLLLDDSSRRLKKERGIRFEADDTVLAYLAEHGGYDPLLGARPMRTVIQHRIETPIAEVILSKRLTDGAELIVTLCQDDIVITQKTDLIPKDASTITSSFFSNYA